MQTACLWIRAQLPTSPHLGSWLSSFPMNKLPAFHCWLNENGRKELGKKACVILLDSSGVAAGIYRFLSFIFLREGADSAVSLVVYTDGRLPLQSAQSKQCDHLVRLPGWTCSFDPQLSHIWLLCSGWQQGDPNQARPAGFPEIPKLSTVVLSIPHYAAPLCLLYSFWTAASFWGFLEELGGRGSQC